MSARSNLFIHLIGFSIQQVTGRVNNNRPQTATMHRQLSDNREEYSTSRSAYRPSGQSKKNHCSITLDTVALCRLSSSLGRGTFSGHDQSSESQPDIQHDIGYGFQPTTGKLALQNITYENRNLNLTQLGYLSCEIAFCARKAHLGGNMCSKKHCAFL